MNGRILVTGTGRCGTSFTMQVFTELGLNTGFDTQNHGFFKDRMCGQELQIPDDFKDEDFDLLPEIIKDPRLMITLQTHIEAGRRPRHVYVLVRRVGDAAQSRVFRGMTWDPATLTERPPAMNGLSEDQRIRKQADYLYVGLGQLVETLVIHEIPHTFALFPRLATDSHYFASTFHLALTGIPLQRVLQAHAKLADPRAIHFGREG